MSPTLGRFLLVGMSLVFSLLLLEGVGRVFLLMAPDTGTSDSWVFLRTQPPPYQHSEYWSEEFVDEVMHNLKQHEAGGRRLQDFEGRWLNIENGLRRTTDQPEHFERRLLVFGASTVLSRRVPDWLTIPSHLQRMLNERPAGIRVENHGFVGDVLTQQLDRLRQAEFGPGDIVVFYDGIAEVLVKLYVLRHRTQLRKGVDDGALRKLNWAQRVAYQARVLAGESAAVRMVFGLQRGTTEVQVERPAKLARIFQRVKQVFYEDQLEAHRLVSERGAHFYHFLQPNLYLHETRTEHEQRIVEDEKKNVPGLERAYAIAYPKLRAAMIEAARAGVAAFDISDAFDVRPGNVDIYFDGAHVNEVANALIAERIYQTIFGAPESGSKGQEAPRS